MFISMSMRACANISSSGAGTGSNDPSGHQANDSYSAPSRNVMPPSSQNDAIVSCPNNVAISEVWAPELGFCICTLLKPATSSRYVPIASAAQNTVDAAMPSTSPITASFTQAIIRNAPWSCGISACCPPATNRHHTAAAPLRIGPFITLSAVAGRIAISTSSRSLDSASSTMKRMNSSPRCCSAKMS
ncbi:Uncharacterised protein [Burkholderia pseudomallei]|nr:Uncharacterised protein [Burkholderia pseudomallei]CAJ9420686.1 Uncharacterised protein [Burkholderia pseudomallei]CAJ9437517.1 Uncharacterised protein [Burkholderia pseudomallei]CAJ9777578.1 Uncharacterised protein [Burkholderia pseudomallei]CAJ9785622.1 Uncharacterised protein [Burkholderia pseudomallei]